MRLITERKTFEVIKGDGVDWMSFLIALEEVR